MADCTNGGRGYHANKMGKKNDVGLVRCYMGAPPGTACTPAITTVRPIEMVAEDNTEWTTSLLSRISRHAANARPS